MQFVGAYEVLGRVTSSGTGAVWKGHDSALGRFVALKQVSAGTVESAARLRSEATILARLSHPNIVSVFDLIESYEQIWLVEEWIDGAALPAVLAEVPRLSPQQALGVVRGALFGLAHAHRQGIVHGDISPSNVLLDRAGTSKLVDFGLAVPSGARGVAGTPGFISPEAARGLPITPASDLYSAAAVLAMLLLGRPLFTGPTAEAVIAAQFATAVPDLAGIENPVRAVLQRGLATDPAARYPDVDQFLAALDDASTQRYGTQWLASAGVAGLVAAAATTGAVMGLGAAFAPASPGVVTSATQARLGAPHVYQQAIADQRRPSQWRIARRFKPHQLAIGAGVTIAAVAVVVAAVAIASHSKPAAKSTAAAIVSRSSLPAVTSSGPAFDLHTIDWQNVLVPGNSCMSPQPIQLNDGSARFSAHDANNLDDGYVVQMTTQPVYGQLGNGGPMVAAFVLGCAGTGGFAGSGGIQNSVVVFDAPQGRPTALKVITGYHPEAGGLSLPFTPTQVQIAGGDVVVSGTFLQATDAHCCPSGRSSATITYVNGQLVAAKSTTSEPASPTVSTPAPTRPGRVITVTARSGRTYVATVQAEDTITDCAANSYGSAIINFFKQHPCSQGAGRRLVSIPIDGRTVALSIVGVGLAGTSSDPYIYASQFSHLEQQDGTGSINDLLRSGSRPAGWPSAIPANETFEVMGEDNYVYVFDAWYLTGSTTNQDPKLVSLISDLFLTQISTVAP